MGMYVLWTLVTSNDACHVMHMLRILCKTQREKPEKIQPSNTKFMQCVYFLPSPLPGNHGSIDTVTICGRSRLYMWFSLISSHDYNAEKFIFIHMERCTNYIVRPTTADRKWFSLRHADASLYYTNAFRSIRTICKRIQFLLVNMMECGASETARTDQARWLAH